MAKIGKNVIESLTRSMYEDSRCIYREYIQNAADQIDLAREQHLEDDGYYSIHVRIFRDQRRIEIEDTATGVRHEDKGQLLDVAASRKKRGEQKGFRGIGRLGGLGYCSMLVFETSAKGEEVKTIIRWDADKMSRILDDDLDESEAGDVIDDCTSFEEQPEEEAKHYFKVILENVKDDRLLDVGNIRDYLSLVSPVDYPTSFSRFAAKIKNFVRSNNLSLDVYNIYVGDEHAEEQIYKAYTTNIRDKRNGDYDVKDIQFFSKKDQADNMIYWGWYSISELRGQMPSENLAYGMRLRCKNIQVGDERTCRNFFVSEGDKRFSQYFYGELHVETPELVPDARRDYIRECDYRPAFENWVREDFKVLKELCNDASKMRSAQDDYDKALEKQEKLEKKKVTGYITPTEREKAEKDFEQFKKNKEAAEQKIVRLQRKMEEKNSPLCLIYSNVGFHPQETAPAAPPQESTICRQYEHPDTHVAGKEAFPASSCEAPCRLLRTDRESYRKFDEKEKKIINVVYSAIYNAIADENMRDSLILKIEKELLKE